MAEQLNELTVEFLLLWVAIFKLVPIETISVGESDGGS